MTDNVRPFTTGVERDYTEGSRGWGHDLLIDWDAAHHEYVGHVFSANGMQRGDVLVLGRGKRLYVYECEAEGNPFDLYYVRLKVIDESAWERLM